jgi:hypothetical protein
LNRLVQTIIPTAAWIKVGWPSVLGAELPG